MTETVKPLAKKLAEVMGKVKNVEKTGRNEQFRYNYAPATEVYAAVRKHLAEAGVIILPKVLDREVKEVSTARGGANYHVVLKMIMYITDGTEALEVPWYAEGMDTQDKGINKALTNALKYFLIDLLLINTGEDDPDARSAPEPQQRAETSVEAPDEPRLTQARADSMSAKLDELGFDTQNALALAERVTKRKVKALTELTEDEAGRIFGAAKRAMAPEPPEPIYKDQAAATGDKPTTLSTEKAQELHIKLKTGFGLEDDYGFASRILDRDVTSFTQLTSSDVWHVWDAAVRERGTKEQRDEWERQLAESKARNAA